MKKYRVVKGCVLCMCGVLCRLVTQPNLATPILDEWTPNFVGMLTHMLAKSPARLMPHLQTIQNFASILLHEKISCCEGVCVVCVWALVSIGHSTQPRDACTC